MGEFFAGLAIVFALLLFGKGGGRGPGALPPGSSGPGNFPPNNPTYNNPPSLPSGPSGSGCGCGGANNYVPAPASQTAYGNIAPSSAPSSPTAPASSYTRIGFGGSASGSRSSQPIYLKGGQVPIYG